MKPAQPSTEMQDLYVVLQKSEKFLAWRPGRILPKAGDKLRTRLHVEKHFTVIEVAKLWGISSDLVRDVFKDEDGVLIIDRQRTRTKRAYSTIRIPESVLARVYSRMSER